MSRTVALALIVVLSLAGCSTAGADQSPATPSRSATAPAPPTATPTPAPAVTATETPTATPSPSAAAPEPPVATAGCENVLTDDEYASLAEDGLVLNPDISAFDDVMQSLMDQGFGCYWTRGGGDVRVWYAQAEQGDDTWAAQRQLLTDAGWTQTDTPIEGVVQAPADHDPNYAPVVVHRDGVTYYASYDRFLASVTALLG